MGKFKRAAAKRRRQATTRTAATVTRAYAPTEWPVRAKVGAVTYSGFVFGDVFTYTTSKGDVHTSHKFTVV